MILDIGSATGHHYEAFSDEGFNAQGIDISTAMIKQPASLSKNELLACKCIKTYVFSS